MFIVQWYTCIPGLRLQELFREFIRFCEGMLPLKIQIHVKLQIIHCTPAGHYYAAATGGKVTVLQSLVITPALHLKRRTHM